jgi:NAD(P)-dependent dehydrogenase (short-subunit alcohol dehydrogenase family)
VADNRVALVTGGGSGIGYACALGLAQAGFDIAIAGRRVEVLGSAARGIQQETRRRVAAIPVDLALPDAPAELVERTTAELSRIDVLVNAAGTCTPVPTASLDAAAWDNAVNVLLRGAALCTIAAANKMPDGGRIIMITSIDEVQSEPNVAHYCAAKAGLGAFARSIAVDLTSRGITVNNVAPGWVHTDTANARLSKATPESLKRLNPLARGGQPAEIAKVVTFLATEAPAYLTGSTITIDGGQTVQAAMP